MNTDESTVSAPLPSTGFKGSDLPPLVTDAPPRVLIAGAGLAGLYLGILLEKAGIPYEIFERTSEIKPLAFEQLGLYDKLLSISKPGGGLATFYTDQLEVIATSTSSHADIVGYVPLFFARPELYDMLFKQIPSENIHMSKKILSFQQNHEGVMLRFSDNTTAHGDILVGADGAHSSVRQHLFKTMDKQGLLPKTDTKAMSKGYISVVGTTDELDPAKYPCLTEPKCEIADDQFKSSDWKPQQNQEMLDLLRDFKTPYGTMGDLFDVTPIERVSKVYYEDMLFETWTHGRTILIGDAAHKLLPSSGAGAVNAMQDAVLLANHLYDIKPTSFENIKLALNAYKEERFDAVKDQYPQSYMSAKLIYGHSILERIIRYVIFNWLPKSVQKKQLIRDSAYRPQANFLPLAPKRGTIDIIPQQPSKRMQKEEEEGREQAEAAATAL
ncbi:hypothetical protein KI688_007597 [Linnemannia hyalina]|uniref:FAD-binding domain-containing protein n=1 Tax=Linnemannia hyalina TaxID=64524 RepID=A0A9P7XJT4_9FUNG|nr:hypothetical protein KI688_007597 [Linnemannia hyalina]